MTNVQQKSEQEIVADLLQRVIQILYEDSL